MWLAGGCYDFRFSLATVLYEFRKDVVTCVLIGGGMWLIDSRREAQRALEVVSAAVNRRPASSTPQTIWLRDGTRSIRIEPREIVWIEFGRQLRRIQPRRRHQPPGPGHAGGGGNASSRASISRASTAPGSPISTASPACECKPSGDFEPDLRLTGQTVAGQPALHDTRCRVASR